MDCSFNGRYDLRYKRSTNAPIVHISIICPCSCLTWTSCGIVGGLGIFRAIFRGVAPLISFRTRTCIFYISAYMFEELWLLVNRYLKCAPVFNVYGAEFMKRDPHWEMNIICLICSLVSQWWRSIIEQRRNTRHLVNNSTNRWAW